MIIPSFEVGITATNSCRISTYGQGAPNTYKASSCQETKWSGGGEEETLSAWSWGRSKIEMSVSCLHFRFLVQEVFCTKHL